MFYSVGTNKIEPLYHVLTGLLAVHEATRYDVGGEQLIALPELLEQDPVGESLSADSDALQHTIAPELVQNQWGVNLASL